MSNMDAKLNIAFIHPDLGIGKARERGEYRCNYNNIIGGAERLVVDAAAGIQSKGHQVVMYTSHHDPNHCFEETRDGTLSVRVFGDFLPREIFGKFYIICAMLRQFALILWILWNDRDTYDVFFVDQLSMCVPLLKWFTSSKVHK